MSIGLGLSSLSGSAQLVIIENDSSVDQRKNITAANITDTLTKPLEGLRELYAQAEFNVNNANDGPTSSLVPKTIGLSEKQIKAQEAANSHRAHENGEFPGGFTGTKALPIPRRVGKR